MALQNAYKECLGGLACERIIGRLSQAVQPFGALPVTPKAWQPIAAAAAEMAEVQLAREKAAVAQYPLEKVCQGTRITARHFLSVMQQEWFRPLTYTQAELLWDRIAERFPIPRDGISRADWPALAADYVFVRDYVKSRVHGPDALDFAVIMHLKPATYGRLNSECDDPSILMDGCPDYPPTVPKWLSRALVRVATDESTFHPR